MYYLTTTWLVRLVEDLLVRVMQVERLAHLLGLLEEEATPPLHRAIIREEAKVEPKDVTRVDASQLQTWNHTRFLHICPL